MKWNEKKWNHIWLGKQTSSKGRRGQVVKKKNSEWLRDSINKLPGQICTGPEWVFEKSDLSWKIGCYPENNRMIIWNWLNEQRLNELTMKNLNK